MLAASGTCPDPQTPAKKIEVVLPRRQPERLCPSPYAVVQLACEVGEVIDRARLKLLAEAKQRRQPLARL